MRALLVAALALALAAPAVASERHPTLNELEGEVMCPICHTTLDQSNSAAAERGERHPAAAVEPRQVEGRRRTGLPVRDLHRDRVAVLVHDTPDEQGEQPGDHGHRERLSGELQRPGHYAATI